ncbi:Murein DD-endopeptidase MepM and murein hydrolase activator NlpD, contain LysM domain [Maridesulfovibrio ferrireducens]|uniref:Murein DD-endopeptidase MepM and murein hydrolase activator NlpD, contain LysM domain n=1 Tax=Maridesulfovibrio ferrireducens TaxID=246191 RepID=A0A1G9LNT0_9BACT|nr:M23 family metallopeptidase [Maridesulfovibrio ferrireducens]SDL63195.1 Murein DD-endopeptidase MepM and murein hydrolase activator NlpD, contain LysM domain [Maridesulfovibrio ferrireducens]
MARNKSRVVPFIILIITLGLLSGGAYLLYKDTDAPQITITPDNGFITFTTPITVNIDDVKSGLKAVKIVLTQGKKKTTLKEQTLPKGTFDYNQEIIIKKKQIKQGDFEIAVWAVDSSLAGFGSGNAIIARGNYTLDTIAPKITVQTSTHNLTQGGCALILYTLDETPMKTGVKSGDDFFPGYKQPNGEYACLFAMPFYSDVKTFNPVLIAEDAAKNKRTSTFWYHTNAKKYKHDNINISDRFLSTKMPQFESSFPGVTNPVDLFLKVNRELRVTNRAELRKLGLDTSPTFLFENRFLRLPNSASRASFGDRRTYLHNGKKIDNQTHLGIDLASTRHAPIPAANKGRIILAAQDFGIYGNAVIIDHGLGLQTLYSHLSQIDVAVGDVVDSGQIIGKTGATGMAGGDHLHYGVICSGIPVNPYEWWDATWIKNNITSKMDQPSN